MQYFDIYIWEKRKVRSAADIAMTMAQLARLKGDVELERFYQAQLWACLKRAQGSGPRWRPTTHMG